MKKEEVIRDEDGKVERPKGSSSSLYAIVYMLQYTQNAIVRIQDFIWSERATLWGVLHIEQPLLWIHSGGSIVELQGPKEGQCQGVFQITDGSDLLDTQMIVGAEEIGLKRMIELFLLYAIYEKYTNQ